VFGTFKKVLSIPA